MRSESDADIKQIEVASDTFSNIAAKSGGSSILVNQAFAILNILFFSIQGNDNKN